MIQQDRKQQSYNIVTGFLKEHRVRCVLFFFVFILNTIVEYRGLESHGVPFSFPVRAGGKYYVFSKNLKFIVLFSIIKT